MPKVRPHPGTRSVQWRLLVLCEGAKDKSESAYFKALINDRRNPDHRLEVKVVDTKKNTARELVREAKKLKATNKDQVWVVFDKDGYTLHAQAFDQAAANGIKIAFSSICFEYWLLLHFGYTTRPFANCSELIAYIRTEYGYDYDKSSPLTYAKTKHLLAQAKTNAQRCRKYQLQSNPADFPIYEMNPYTNVDELVTAIEQFSVEEA
jgi:lipopolysaccharide export LptBFGC system permease protein LptF